MATIDKSKSQTYDFLSKNKSIENVKKQANIKIKEKRRHGGVTYKLIEINNTNNQSVNDDLSENEIFYDAVDDLNNISSLEISQTQIIIQEKDNEIQQLKKQIEELKQAKESDVNLTKYTYNSITINDEKQRKKTEIEKIHEEILSIEDKIIFITTFIHIDNSITEKILYFDYYKNNDDLQIVNQVKKYQNINEYKNDFSLIEDTSTNKNNCQYVPIKDFLKYQQDFKLKPNKSEKKIWWTITIISLTLIILTPILTFAIPALISATATALLLETKIIIAVTSSGLGTIFKGFTSIFSPATKKVESWWYNKLCKNNEKKEKEKNERQSIIKNLTNDKLETKLQTQYEILKQELNNKKDKTINELLNNKTINNSSNIEPLKVSDFDSSIRNTVNQQEQQPSTSTIYHSNSML